MTAALWMAAPPEVHSALLSVGPGPAALTAASAAWNALSIEYASAAAELTDLVSTVGSGIWEGVGAESCVAAHTPFAAWLLDASANSAATAAQHQIAAGAYAAALAAMPTLAELAANHAAHGALVATNFFGINTIPIALNEADYVRMWIQAATTMTIYQATTAAAVASTPQPVPAPQVLKSTGPAASLDPGRALITAVQSILLQFGVNPLIRNPLVSNVVTDFIADVLENFGIYWDPATGMLNGAGYESYADATQPMWYVARSLELIGDSMQMTQNPAQALQYFVALSVFDWPTHIAQFGNALTQAPLLLAAVGGAMLVPAAATGGMAGLAGLAGLPHAAAVPAPAPVSPLPGSPPIAAMSSPATAFASAPAPSPTPGPAPSTVSAAGAAPATPPSTGAGFMAPYAVGPPGIGFDSGMTSSVSAKAKKKAPEPEDAAAAAQSRAAIRRQARARQRKRTAQRHYGDEFMDMDVEVDPDWEPLDPDQPGVSATASNQGAGHLGLAGTASQDAVVEASGLTKLTGDEFGGGPTMPMVPSIWR